MTNRLIFVCSLFATSTARGFSEFPLAFLPNFRYLPTYRWWWISSLLWEFWEKNSTDIEVVFSYLRHMERTQRFQIEGRNISDYNRSLNLMKFYYHTRLYLRPSINFIVPDRSPPLECNYRVTMINRWNPKANTATDNSVHFPGSSTTVQPAEPCRAYQLHFSKRDSPRDWRRYLYIALDNNSPAAGNRVGWLLAVRPSLD